ncbi:MAG: hypothetical protein AAGE01_00260 [Pseudomonadota bacterium]
MERAPLRSALACLTIVILAGCGARGGATIPDGATFSLAPDQPQDVRALLEHQHRQRYLADRRRCLARGGRMVIQASHALGRQTMPRRGDFYTCA